MTSSQQGCQGDQSNPQHPVSTVVLCLGLLRRVEEGSGDRRDQGVGSEELEGLHGATLASMREAEI